MDKELKYKMKDQEMEQVQQTSVDALVSRQSCIDYGYLEDEYCFQFLNSLKIKGNKKSPLINRGTFLRNIFIQNSIVEFLNQADGGGGGGERQVVNLGCGFDTKYLLLKDGGAKVNQNFHYFEVDYQPIVDLKKKCILQDTTLSSKYKLKPTGSTDFCHSEEYFLISGDLNQFESQVIPKLYQLGFNLNVPTLIVAECLFVYMEPNKVTGLLQYFQTQILKCKVLIYDMVLELKYKPFGDMMVTNLKRRGLNLPGLKHFGTKTQQLSRFQQLNFTVEKFHTVLQLYHSLPLNERLRLDRLELLDEVEEWVMLASHYAITLLSNY